MNEVEIYNNLNNSLIATGLFFIGWSFLVWVAGRAVTIAIENNAPDFIKTENQPWGAITPIPSFVDSGTPYTGKQNIEIEWKQNKPVDNIIHIHGSKDLIFPTNLLSDYIELPGGDHAMILKRAEWINKKIPKLIEEN